MELKYYLRGLGLGIVVTAIIMGLTTSKSRTMTDAEIISRAKQLGMTEEKTLKDTVADEDAKTEDHADEGDADSDVSYKDVNADDDALSSSVSVTEPNGEDSSGDATDIDLADSSLQDENDEQIQMPEEESGEADSEQEISRVDADVEPTADDAETGSDTSQSTSNRTNASMVVTIGSGDGSYAASRKLADIGAVSSAESFDTFLCQNGYDKRIRPGTYTIPEGASNEQMARIITGAE